MGTWAYIFAAIGGILTVIIAISANHHRDGALWLGCTAVCAFVVSGFCWYQNVLWTNDAKNQPAEDFSAKYSWSLNQLEGPQIWFVQNSTVTHIPSAVAVYFTNLRSTPTMIYSMWVEQKSEDGKWEKVGLPFGIIQSQTYMGIDRKDVTEYEIPTLEAAFNNKNLSANETIQGWLLLTKPLRPIFPR